MVVIFLSMKNSFDFDIFFDKNFFSKSEVPQICQKNSQLRILAVLMTLSPGCCVSALTPPGCRGRGGWRRRGRGRGVRAAAGGRAGGQGARSSAQEAASDQTAASPAPRPLIPGLLVPRVRRVTSRGLLWCSHILCFALPLRHIIQ